jgi:hypothetical protein
LQDLFDRFAPYVATTTSIILSSPVTHRIIVRTPQKKEKKRPRTS